MSNSLKFGFFKRTSSGHLLMLKNTVEKFPDKTVLPDLSSRPVVVFAVSLVTVNDWHPASPWFETSSTGQSRRRRR